MVVTKVANKVKLRNVVQNIESTVSPNIEARLGITIQSIQKDVIKVVATKNIEDMYGNALVKNGVLPNMDTAVVDEHDCTFQFVFSSECTAKGDKVSLRDRYGWSVRVGTKKENDEIVPKNDIDTDIPTDYLNGLTEQIVEGLIQMDDKYKVLFVSLMSVIKGNHYDSVNYDVRKAIARATIGYKSDVKVSVSPDKRTYLILSQEMAKVNHKMDSAILSYVGENNEDASNALALVGLLNKQLGMSVKEQVKTHLNNTNKSMDAISRGLRNLNINVKRAKKKSDFINNIIAMLDDLDDETVTKMINVF